MARKRSREAILSARRLYLVALALALGLAGCAPTYTTTAIYGNGSARAEIDLMSLVDTAGMNSKADTAGVSRIVLYHHPALEREAEAAFAHVISMRNTAYELLRSNRIPDMEFYLLHVPKRAKLVYEQKYREPRDGEARTFGTARFPLPFQDAPSPGTDFYYQPATFVLTHEMVELALVNELGDINHKEGCRWFFEGTANYVAQAWQSRQDVPRTERDVYAGKVWLWLLGDDILLWGEDIPAEGVGYYFASTQAVTNLFGQLERGGIDEPLHHILEAASPRRPLPDVISGLSGPAFNNLFSVPDDEIDAIKLALLSDLRASDPGARDDAIALLQLMSDRLSQKEKDRVDAAVASVEIIR